jgi:hypothetical protein
MKRLAGGSSSAVKGHANHEQYFEHHSANGLRTRAYLNEHQNGRSLGSRNNWAIVFAA